jgi:trimeric autotransporter adhesin
MLRPALAWVNRVAGSRRAALRGRRVPGLRLLSGIEHLEDRALLATVTVHVFNFDFSINPSGQNVVDPTIDLGDTIHWVWDSGTHTSTSVTGSAETWNSGAMSAGGSFDHTFTHSGTFSYYCMFHGSDNGNGTAGGMSGTVTVVGLQSIAVTPANPSVTRGGTEQFAATGMFSDGSTIDLTNQVTWASATPSVATINAAGLASAVAVGTSSISATDGAISGSTVLTVAPATLQSIAVTPADPAVVRGQTEQFAATGTFSDGSTSDLTSQVTWASATPSVATISSAGLASTLGTGTTTISAMLGTVMGTTVLTVTPAALQSIAITPANPTIPNGDTEQFAATGMLSDGSTMDLTNQVTWASAIPGVASISSAGLASTHLVGASTIRAQLGTVAGTTVLTVGAPVLASIAVTPAGPSVAKGRTEQFAATGTLSDGSTEDLTTSVTWASSTPGVATISASGLAATLGTGSSTIGASLAGLTGSTVLTVTPAVAASIAVSPASPSIFKGQSEPFTATATLTDGTTGDVTTQVTWASATPSVATIDAAGLASSLAAGTSSISATLGGVTGSTTLTVQPAAVVSIVIVPASPSIATGTSEHLAAIGTLTDSSTEDVTSQVTWTSATPTVATVNAAGIASGLTVGTSTISAHLGNLSANTTLTVRNVTLVSIAISPANPNLPKGEIEAFVVTGTFDDSSTQDLSGQVTWSSSASAVASITPTGQATAVAIGQATITAARGAITDTTVLTVTPAALLSISVTPAGATLPKGESRQFTATGNYSDSTTVDLSNQVTWASSASAVASISTSGLAAGVATGNTSITGTFGGVTGSTALTVSPAALLSIAVTPAAPNLAAGLMQQFTAAGTYSDATTVDLTNQVTWSSGTPAVATITSAGMAMAMAQGQTSIGASLGAVAGSTELTVSPAALMEIDIVPFNPTIFDGKTESFMAMGMYTDNSMQDLTGQVAWTSSAPAVATIDPTGLATGLSAGSTAITATLGDMSGTTLLTVQPASLVSISIVPSDSSLPKGGTHQFAAIGNFSDGSTQDLSSEVAWSSSNPAAAGISATGLVTGVSAGGSTIGATLGVLTASTQLSISSPTLVSIAVASPGPILSQGGTEQLTVTGVFTDGSTQDLTRAVAWTSSNPSVATITSSGVAAGIASGSASITAMFGNLGGTTALTVTSVNLVSIAINPANSGLHPGQAEGFTATGVFSDGTSRDLSGQVAWTSSAPAVATITASGVASAVSAGSTSITAAFGGVSGSTVLAVTSVVIVPPNPLFVAAGVKVKARAHRGFSGTVASLKDPHTVASDFHATIDWGDGSAPTVGRIRRVGNGRYTISGSHRFGATGTFHAVVTIRDAQGRQITAQSQVQVRK